ncbi:hypothetical protein RDWZM_004445, partial [Blomia tropicalis]
ANVPFPFTWLKWPRERTLIHLERDEPNGNYNGKGTKSVDYSIVSVVVAESDLSNTIDTNWNGDDI